jgi:hypothetical protein
MATINHNQEKVIDIVVESLRQAMRTADLAFAFAVTATAIVFAWGMQGDYEKVVRTPVATQQSTLSSPTPNPTIPKEIERLQVEVPVLGFKANQSTAAMLGLVCYVIFTVRAGNHLLKARDIAQRLRTLDDQMLDALLTTPSIATAGRWAQIALSIILGLLAYVAFGLFLSPFNTIIGKPSSETWQGASIIILPAVYFGWQLLKWRAPVPSSQVARADSHRRRRTRRS